MTVDTSYFDTRKHLHCMGCMALPIRGYGSLTQVHVLLLLLLLLEQPV